jgi:hypothetical protein
MEDYPRTLIEFREKFANEDDCVKYLASLSVGWMNFVAPDAAILKHGQQSAAL